MEPRIEMNQKGAIASKIMNLKWLVRTRLKKMKRTEYLNERLRQEIEDELKPLGFVDEFIEDVKILNRTNHAPEKAYNDILKNLHRLTELENLPFDKIYIPEDYSNNSDIFVEKKGKFHKSCRNKINDMKLKSEKRIQLTEMTERSEPDDCRILDEPSERRRSGRTSQIDEKNVKRECFFCGEIFIRHRLLNCTIEFFATRNYWKIQNFWVN